MPEKQHISEILKQALSLFSDKEFKKRAMPVTN